MFLVDGAHKSRSRWQDFVNEDKDGLLGCKLDALSDNIDKLTDSKILDTGVRMSFKFC